MQIPGKDAVGWCNPGCDAGLLSGAGPEEGRKEQARVTQNPQEDPKCRRANWTTVSVPAAFTPAPLMMQMACRRVVRLAMEQHTDVDELGRGLQPGEVQQEPGQLWAQRPSGPAVQADKSQLLCGATVMPDLMPILQV